MAGFSDPGVPTLGPMIPPDTLDTLRTSLREGRERLRRWHEGGASGGEIVRATSDCVDRVVVRLFSEAWASAGGPEGFLLLATGGYGRRELAPHSDVDLLILHGSEDPAEVSRVTEPFLKGLWDVGLSVGAAIRTQKEALELLADPTIRTTLLDSRLLHGDGRQAAGFLDTVHQVPEAAADTWIEAKAREMAQRRQRYGGTVHLLEPNVKQSPGGLRDLHTALWIARARYGAGDLRDLLVRGILPSREVETLEKARDRLWRIRNQLHYLAGRKQDHLTFHWQEEVARALGYRDRDPDGLAVEQFMKDTYLAASAIERLADGMVARSTRGRPRQAVGQVPPREGLEWRGGQLTVADRRWLWRDPSLFVWLFVFAERLGVEISPWARDLLREEALRIDDGIRRDPAVAGALKDAFERLHRARWLREMHREGVLGALLPEFGRVTARHQHDLYHVYTVDVHTLFAMERLGGLLAGDHLDEEPGISLVARDLPRRLPLSLGVLFHDSGKGLGGHHSEKGATLVEQVCDRLEVPYEEARDAVFLVREHLSMSHVSQRRDLSDPELIRDFAQRMGSRSRLDMLYVLTYVDIASVGPGTWTPWKASLLRELHEKARGVLEGGEHRGAALASTRAILASRGRSEGHVDAFVQRLPGRYFSFAPPAWAPDTWRALGRFDSIAGRVGRERALVALATPSGGTTRVLLATGDRPGLLSAIAGVFTAHKIDVLRADVFSTTDGVAIDFFVVQGPTGSEVERERWRRARRDLAAILDGRLGIDELMARMVRPSGLPGRHVPGVEPKIRVDNETSRRFTIVDVVAEDRRGLLHDVTSVLHGASLAISVARIATEGNRAIDSFYVSGPAGEKIDDPERIAALQKLLLQAVGAASLPGPHIVPGDASGSGPDTSPSRASPPGGTP